MTPDNQSIPALTRIETAQSLHLLFVGDEPPIYNFLGHELKSQEPKIEHFASNNLEQVVSRASELANAGVPVAVVTDNFHLSLNNNIPAYGEVLVDRIKMAHPEISCTIWSPQPLAYAELAQELGIHVVDKSADKVVTQSQEIATHIVKDLHLQPRALSAVAGIDGKSGPVGGDSVLPDRDAGPQRLP